MTRMVMALHGSLWMSAVLITAITEDKASADDKSVYELRIYTCEPGKLDALHERFREHTMRIFEKHGMENVAYWVPTDEPKSANTLVYLLRHKSREAAKLSWMAFRDDPEWKAVAEASRAKDGNILSMPPVSVYLAATDYSPEVKPVQPGKLYELRVYTAAEGKLDALHARFREHTDGLFAKHGMKAYAYWKPVDQPQSQTTLYYVLETPSRDRARESWRAFAADPQWEAVRKATEAGGSLLAQRPESTYMIATDYSPSK